MSYPIKPLHPFVRVAFHVGGFVVGLFIILFVIQFLFPFLPWYVTGVLYFSFSTLWFIRWTVFCFSTEKKQGPLL